MTEPRFWQKLYSPQSLALMPVSLIYRALEKLNRILTHTQHPGKPVICVGNLTAGGAGKTPTTRLLAQYFAAQGKSVAVLSRGYKASLKTPMKVDPTLHSAAQVGDEPLMLAQETNTYIGANRMAALRLAVADGADLFIKDDGFQNPAMGHGFNLIVVDGASGLGNGRLLPAGPLRQPLRVAIGHIDALLVIGKPAHRSLPPLIAAAKARHIGVYHAHTKPHPISITGEVLAFCGIAKPEKFYRSLTEAGLRVTKLQTFADHHSFTEAEAQSLLSEAEKTGAQLITTRKDMARLAHAGAGARSRLARASNVLDIELVIEKFDALVAQISRALATELN